MNQFFVVLRGTRAIFLLSLLVIVLSVFISRIVNNDLENLKKKKPQRHTPGIKKNSVTANFGDLSAFDIGEILAQMEIEPAENIQSISSTDLITLDGNVANGNFGIKVASGGDIDGDGYGEILVGAPDYPLPSSKKGAIFIYYGSADGFDLAKTDTLRGNTLFPTATVNFLGYALSFAGDVNGDGYADILVGVEELQLSLVLEGSATGINTSGSGASATQLTGAATTNFGWDVSNAGDINADGYSDIMVASTNAGTHSGGEVYIYNGSSSGVETTPVDTLANEISGSQFGHTLALAGDINGDGLSDVSSFAGGNFYVYYSDTTGAKTNKFFSTSKFSPTSTSTSVNGTAASGAGDVNGDGYSDIVAGSSFLNNGQLQEGGFFVYHGSSSGLNTSAAVSFQSNKANSSMGNSVSSAGDVNGDGYNDILVGVQNYEVETGSGFHNNNRGLVLIYYGSSTGIVTAEPDSIVGTETGAMLGASVSGAGDINGDGISDVIAGAPEKDNGSTNEGVAYVYTGRTSYIGTSPLTLLSSATKTPATVSILGDINGDGFSDMAIGHWQRDSLYIIYGEDSNTAFQKIDTLKGAIGSRLGWAISGGGDINGDGYSDFVVTAPRFKSETSFSRWDGAAFIFYGDPDLGETKKIAFTDTVTGKKNVSFSGYNGIGDDVAIIKDVNSDGYDELLVSSSNFEISGNYGAVFLYRGGPSKNLLNSDRDTLQGISNTSFGIWVSDAGDLRGDGRNDFVVGASTFSNGHSQEGAAYLYEVDAEGYSSSPIILEGNEANKKLGITCGSLGDVDGDGYDDLGVLGDSVLNIYKGSSSGISTTPSGSTLGGQFSMTYGDLNGDGYSDYVLGDHLANLGKGAENAEDGVVIAYKGGSSFPGEVLKSFTSTDEGIGWSIGGIGDVNGDGYTDLMMGYDERGEVDLFLGNSGGGMIRQLRVYNSGSTEPYSVENAALSNFSIGLTNKNPEGRSKGRIVWVTRGSGQPLPTRNNVAITGSSTYNDLTKDGTELTGLVPKLNGRTRVMARTEYEISNSLHGQRYSPWVQPTGINGISSYDVSLLPVELAHFEVILTEENTVDIYWETASEKDNNFFTLEKSPDAENWKILRIVDGNGTTHERQFYSTQDDKPFPNVTFYRLKQTDFDGRFEYFEIKYVKINYQETAFKIYPNPATEFVTLEGPVISRDELRVFQLSGVDVTPYIGLGEIYPQKLSLNLSSLANGIYVIKTAYASFPVIKQ